MALLGNAVSPNIMIDSALPLGEDQVAARRRAERHKIMPQKKKPRSTAGLRTKGNQTSSR
jgi:hypothetical protein